MKPAFSTAIGLCLIGIAMAGFLIVADDLPHSGELFAVAGILMSGVALFVSSRFPHITTHLCLAWLPVGIGIGMLIGAMIDKEPSGVSFGLPLGLLLARMFRRRDRTSCSR